MRTISLALLAGVSLIVIAPAAAAAAQPAAAQAPAATDPDVATLGEIVVTARRRAESLQEVPQTVSAVTADTLQKLNITQFTDVQSVVPGLSLQQNGQGFQAAASLRGVTFDVNTSAQPTVAMYINDAPVEALYMSNSLFDVGQIEVLRGPQGTTRGVSAPSGAITLTTHKPDLSELGGYFDATATDHQGRNVQGAINVPIIKDVLAVRAAAVYDLTDFDGVRSIHNNMRPRQMTDATRFSVSFEPTDAFNANVTYAHIDKSVQSFDQVSGPGQGTFLQPPISPDQRAAVESGYNDARTHLDIVTAQVDSRIFGQHLSYVGSYQHVHVLARGIGGGGDGGYIVPGVELSGVTDSTSVWTTQEFRVASDPAPGRFFDYTVGAYYNWQNNTGHVVDAGPLLPGAFGNPANGVNPGAFNPFYMIPLDIDVPSTLQETSLFGSVTLHLGAKTELSGGIRHIWSIVNNHTLLTTGTGHVALPASVLGGSCGSFGSTYPGFCDFTVAGGSVVANLNSRTSETPNIYNVSLSHHLTRDFMLYANTGTAYRPPVASVGIFGALANSTAPGLSTLSFHPAETSRSYEVGFKWTFLDGRARLNADVFRQRFHNFTLLVPNVNYLNTASNAVSAFAFTASVDALVQGFEIDTAYQITADWNVALEASYSDGKVQGSLVPCNAATPLSPTNLVNLCPGGSASRLPYWNATLTSEYDHPVTDTVDGFIRGILTYYPQSKNREEVDFTVDQYSLLNLYLGVRSHDGAWEASIFARNAFATDRTLDTSPVAYNLNTPLSTSFKQLIPPNGSGYYQTLTTPERQVGVNVRYAWGSR